MYKIIITDTNYETKEVDTIAQSIVECNKAQIRVIEERLKLLVDIANKVNVIDGASRIMSYSIEDNINDNYIQFRDSIDSCIRFAIKEYNKVSEDKIDEDKVFNDIKDLDNIVSGD